MWTRATTTSTRQKNVSRVTGAFLDGQEGWFRGSRECSPPLGCLAEAFPTFLRSFIEGKKQATTGRKLFVTDAVRFGYLHTSVLILKSDYQELVAASEGRAVPLGDRLNTAGLWMFRGELFLISEDLSESKAMAAIAVLLQTERKVAAREAAAVASLGTNDAKAVQRQAIPDDVKVVVWQRDQGQCVRCGSRAQLEFDHIIPLSMGGANTMRNLQLLCEACNRGKGGSLA